MSKQDLRLFLASFAITLLFFGFVAAFLLVDSSSSRQERGSTEKLWETAQTAPGAWEVTLLGRKSSLSLGSLRQLSNAYTRFATVLAPRGLYSLDAMYDYGVYWGDEFYKKYKEKIYQQETGGQAARSLPPNAVNGS